MESDSCEGVKIDPIVRINPHLHCGVTHKEDCGVDKIPLLNLDTLFVHGLSYHLLNVENSSLFPLVFLGKKLIVTSVDVGSI